MLLINHSSTQYKYVKQEQNTVKINEKSSFRYMPGELPV